MGGKNIKITLTRPHTDNKTNLIFTVQQLELIINEAVLGAFLLSQRSLLLQLRRPERLYTVHGTAQLLIRQVQFAFQVAQFSLQIRVLMLQVPDKRSIWAHI